MSQENLKKWRFLNLWISEVQEQWLDKCYVFCSGGQGRVQVQTGEVGKEQRLDNYPKESELYLIPHPRY